MRPWSQLQVLGASLFPVPSRLNRQVHGLAALAMLAVLGGAACLTPDPCGKGTHRQLGLPPCLVCRVTGKERCPSCGLTTAFAHAVRGHFGAAGRCNPAGMPLFALCLALLLYSAAIAVTGKNWVGAELLVVMALELAALGLWVHAFLNPNLNLI